MIRYFTLIGALAAFVSSLAVMAVPAGSYSAPNRAEQHDKHARCSAGSKKHSSKDKRAARSTAKCRKSRRTQSHNSSRMPSTSPPPSAAPPDTTTTPSTPSPAPPNPPATLTPPSCPPFKRPVGTAGTGIYGDIAVEGGPFGTCGEQAGGEVQVLNGSGSVVASTTVAKGETFNLAVEPGTYRVVGVLAPGSSCEGPPVTVISGQEKLVEIPCDVP
jgi:hypothetical protein